MSTPLAPALATTPRTYITPCQLLPFLTAARPPQPTSQPKCVHPQQGHSGLHHSHSIATRAMTTISEYARHRGGHKHSSVVLGTPTPKQKVLRTAPSSRFNFETRAPSPQRPHTHRHETRPVITGSAQSVLITHVATSARREERELEERATTIIRLTKHDVCVGNLEAKLFLEGRR